ncbi:hypothetical protein [Bacillus sp. Marseille-P3661]|uniref:hypothetical protein n=1 Tax=Bacillus sp. Marseille-P3661 TaxID=1936234 RepID=UPI000C861431|nr:hypothetical protein [Bacillus sp. Marseille-P3661]
MKSNLLTLELMEGQERLFEALEMRGFLVEKKGPFLSLASGSAALDYQALRRLLRKYNIPVYWDGDHFQLLVNRFPVIMMKKITTEQGHEFSINMQDYQYKWRAFVTRKYGLKVNTMDLDPYIASLVKAVNQAGIACLAGCDGHLKYAPNLQFSGVYNGAWFHIIQKHYFKDLELNYTWEVNFKGRSGASLFASKKGTESWDMRKIYEDTLYMAYRLKEHSEEVRNIKINSFRRNREMKEVAEGYRKSGNYLELVGWMEEVSFQEKV